MLTPVLNYDKFPPLAARPMGASSMPTYLIYLDFELEIGAGDGPEYPVEVVHSPAGEARSTIRLPHRELALENRLKDLQIALLRSNGARRQIPSPEEAVVQHFGSELFDALFTGEVRSRYDVSQELAHQQGKGLRLKLRIHPPALAALPWEFLYDARGAEYICLSRNTPVVRYLELAQPIQPLLITPPLRILGMVVSPTDLEPLDTKVEQMRVERALRTLQAAGLVELTWLEGNTWRDLQRAMRNGPWHIFHFIGHGGFDSRREEGMVALANDEGRAHFFSATDLGRLLADHRSLRLVLLNACEGARGGTHDIFSSTAATLIRRGIAAVVAMQYAISDAAAIEFSQMFYESLVDAMPADAAVAEARKAVSFARNNSLEWGTPVLYMRAPDGQIFSVQSAQDADIPNGRSKLTDDRPKLNDDRPTTLEPINHRSSTEKTAIQGSGDYLDAHPVVQPPAPTVEFDWVTIPAGDFLMGSDRRLDPLAYDDELPQHCVGLSSYRISRTPVTNAQYQRFVVATGHPAPLHWENGRCPAGKERHPVVYVSWHDAQAFCTWAGCRLPSEAEWEKSARGTDGRLYPWGDVGPDESVCNYNMDVGDTTPVGHYPENVSPYGLVDIAGNVWEWTASLWGREARKPDFVYPYTREDGRENKEADDGLLRVVRGGAFFNFDNQVRCAYRHAQEPNYREDTVGFRVVAIAKANESTPGAPSSYATNPTKAPGHRWDFDAKRGDPPRSV